MNTIRHFFILPLVLLGTLIGIQLPSYTDLYGSILNAHVNESKHSLNEFQDDADKFFNGDIQLLITYYNSSNDHIIKEGGNSISAIYHRHLKLKKLHNNFNKNSFTPFYYSLIKTEKGLQQETLLNYDFTIKLSPIAIGIGLTCGLFLSIIAEQIITLLLFLLRKPKRNIKHNN